MPPVVFTPHPGAQTKFLRSGVLETAYGGAAGGGKSYGLGGAGLRFFGHPFYRGKIFRRTRTQATELIIKIGRLVRGAFPGAQWKGSEHAFVHPKGGRLEIGYMRHDLDLENEQGQEYQFIAFDEATHFPEHQVLYMLSRLRGNEGLMPHQFRLTCNPGGIGHLWFKARYIDAGPAGEVIWERIRLESGRIYYRPRMFIPARLEDNPSLGDAYEANLAALPPALYKALRLGDWNAIIGAAFMEFDAEQHLISWADFAQLHGLVLEPDPGNPGGYYCKIPKHWPIFMGYDWGAASPFSFGWYTVDPQGRMYRIREYYGAMKDRNGRTVANKGLGLPTREQFRRAKELEVKWGIHDRISLRIADSQVFAGRGVDDTGPSVADIAAEEGFFLTRADKHRVLGKSQVHDRLRVSEFEDDAGDVEETPGFMVIRESNPEWCRTVPVLPTAPRNPEDVDSDTEDHIYDEMRYVMMAHPWKPKLIRETRNWQRKLKKKEGSRWTM
jgi:Terminase large subunit, T4likevirus-type, N-terminal